jgi:mRNA-degrading endonuclease toxin of MazEF toxin-antitoxin module
MDNIQMIPTHKSGSLITYLSSNRIEEVKQAIAFAPGISAPIFGY